MAEAPLERIFVNGTVVSATKMTTWATMETKAMRRMSWGMPAVMGLSQPCALFDPFLMRTQRVGHHAQFCNARLLDAVHDLHHRPIGNGLIGSEKNRDPGVLVMQRLQLRLEQAQRDRILVDIDAAIPLDREHHALLRFDGIGRRPWQRGVHAMVYHSVR